MKITKHAEKRGWERLKLKKKPLLKIAEKALKEGIKHAEVKGSLRRYVDKLYLEYKKANGIRIYHEHVWFFRGSILITIVRLSNKYC